MILPACGESFIFPRTAGHMSSRIAGATSPAVHFELPRFTLTPNLPTFHNRAWYNAIAAVATSSVILGDKGDGSPRAREVAKQRYAIYNDGYVSDIIEKNATHNGNCWPPCQPPT